MTPEVDLMLFKSNRALNEAVTRQQSHHTDRAMSDSFPRSDLSSTREASA
jgi:hypothetical protein